MRTLFLFVLLAANVAYGQDTLRIDLRLPRTEMRKAAWNQNTAAWCLLFGSAFTYVASTPKHADEGDALAVGLGAITLGLTTTFMIGASKHQRRAGDGAELDVSTHNAE